MYQVRVRELKNQTGEIMRRVRDGERIALTYHGRVLRMWCLLPMTTPRPTSMQHLTTWMRLLQK